MPDPARFHTLYAVLLMLAVAGFFVGVRWLSDTKDPSSQPSIQKEKALRAGETGSA